MARQRQRESRRYEVTNVPASIRNRDRVTGRGRPVLRRYERIAFDKSLLGNGSQPAAAFVCPGHPLLDAVIDITLESNRDLLRQGTVLVDDLDPGTEPRVLFFLEHSIQDASVTPAGARRVISRQVLYVELDAAGNTRHLEFAPYLDYRPLGEDEPGHEAVLARPECAWIGSQLEQMAQQYAVSQVVPEHLEEIRNAKCPLIAKTKAAVQDRLTKEISYWDYRAEDLKVQEQAGPHQRPPQFNPGPPPGRHPAGTVAEAVGGTGPGRPDFAVAAGGIGSDSGSASGSHPFHDRRRT